MIEEDDPSAGAADAPHLLRHLHRIRDDADQVWRVDDVERSGRELEVGGIHLEDPNVADVLVGNPLAGLLEHRSGEIDPGDRTVFRIEREIDPGPDTDLEHTLTRLDIHPLDGLEAARMKGRTER